MSTIIKCMTENLTFYHQHPFDLPLPTLWMCLPTLIDHSRPTAQQAATASVQQSVRTKIYTISHL